MSYLADPPDNPIDIDGDVQYNYVIAQQGASGMSVEEDEDFDFALTSGSPAMLRLTFTGATDTVPIYKTVTIRLQVPEGELTHTPNFRVLPTGSQRVPNITSLTGRGVAPGAPINMTIKSDITADSFSCENLPGTLSCTTAGRITGTAPVNGSFNVITLVATKDAYHYKRYFVLTVGSGSYNAQPFFRFPDLP